MDEKTIAQIHKENLSTYFVLPLLKLNKTNFVAENNFVETYLTRDMQYVVVNVIEFAFIKHRMLMHPNFTCVWKKENRYYIQYKIPEKWQPDVKLFLAGRFSEMSDGAKELIRLNSGLQWRVPEPPSMVPMTDIRILALERSKAVRDLMEDYYNITLDEKDELLSKPKPERIFIDLTTLTPYSAER